MSNRDHYHDILEKLDFNSLLEVGCDGDNLPNLVWLREKHPSMKLAGCDILTTDKGRDIADKHNILLNKADITKGIPYPDKSFDVVLCPAVLMTLLPTQLSIPALEMKRIARKYIFLLELDGEETDMSSWPGSPDRRFVHNYKDWFKHECEEILTPRETWPGLSYPEGMGKIMIFKL